jgi:hypothetical protein
MLRALCILLLLNLSVFADPVNLSGAWQLNVKRSTWSAKPRPNKVVLTIEHAEPKFKYSGEVESADGAVSNFAFDGAIDGREYNLTDSGLTHKMSVRRVSDDTITAQVRFADAKSEEFSTTKLADDGKTLVRTIRLKTPEGNVRWREIYERLN